jgi:hypothetical protein
MVDIMNERSLFNMPLNMRLYYTTVDPSVITQPVRFNIIEVEFQLGSIVGIYVTHCIKTSSASEVASGGLIQTNDSHVHLTAVSTLTG